MYNAAYLTSKLPKKQLNKAVSALFTITQLLRHVTPATPISV